MLTIKDFLLMHFPLSGLQLEEWETKKRAHLSDLPKVKNQTIEFLISEVSMMTFVIIIIIIIITIIIATFL